MVCQAVMAAWRWATFSCVVMVAGLKLGQAASAAALALTFSARASLTFCTSRAMAAGSTTGAGGGVGGAGGGVGGAEAGAALVGAVTLATAFVAGGVTAGATCGAALVC